MKPTTTHRPNILWLMSDQHHAGCMGCVGHPDVLTPNLDRLAQQGVRFDHAYCNNPICGPSRVSMICGQYIRTLSITGNTLFQAEIPNPGTLPTYLRQHGYQTAFVGKAHMIEAWDQAGYEHRRYCDLCDAHGHDPRTCHYFDYLVQQNLADQYDLGSLPTGHPGHDWKPFVSTIPYEHSVERWTGNEAVAFLRQRDSERPFFLQVSFQRPHGPLSPSPEHAFLYDPEKIQLPSSARELFTERLKGKPAFQQQHARMTRPTYPHVSKDESELRQHLAHYYSLITVIDQEIGRILDQLHTDGQLENTIILYFADHGDFAGEHGLMAKNLGIYEAVHRVPMILVYPGCPTNQVRRGLVELVDVYPTLCDLAGLPIPSHNEGLSMMPVARGEAEGKQAVYCEWDFPHPMEQERVCAIRTVQHRLVHYARAPLDGELYDHETDPMEMNNLFGRMDQLAVQLRLTQQLLTHVSQGRRVWGLAEDKVQNQREEGSPTWKIHKQGLSWSTLAGAESIPRTQN